MVTGTLKSRDTGCRVQEYRRIRVRGQAAPADTRPINQRSGKEMLTMGNWEKVALGVPRRKKNKHLTHIKHHYIVNSEGTWSCRCMKEDRKM